MKATEKQLEFIKLIEDALGCKFNFESGTKQDASEYISAHIEEYKQYQSKNGDFLCVDWSMPNGD